MMAAVTILLVLAATALLAGGVKGLFLMVAVVCAAVTIPLLIAAAMRPAPPRPAVELTEAESDVEEAAHGVVTTVSGG